jgi:NhaP-type Na+/H+ or K+/H+ antiporter
MLKHIYNNRLVEGSLIIGLSYLTFWLAELVMGTSAVLAIVVMGLYMNQMRSVISSECYEFLHEVYELVAHLMNTIIFAIAGIKVRTHHSTDHHS